MRELTESLRRYNPNARGYVYDKLEAGIDARQQASGWIAANHESGADYFRQRRNLLDVGGDLLVLLGGVVRQTAALAPSVRKAAVAARTNIYDKGICGSRFLIDQQSEKYLNLRRPP